MVGVAIVLLRPSMLLGQHRCYLSKLMQTCRDEGLLGVD